MAHVLFCDVDPTECLWNNAKSRGSPTLWSKWQKTAALASCCAGVVLFSIARRKRHDRRGHEGLGDAELHTASAAEPTSATAEGWSESEGRGLICPLGRSKPAGSGS